MKHYYAMSWSHGRAACANTGNRYGVEYYAFSRKERDEWCEDGGDFTSSPNWREAVKSNDPELRRAIKSDEVQYTNS
jgi:hypothetical protein